MKCDDLAVARRLGYADAVKVLGAKESALVSALDKIFGGALLGGVTFGLDQLLGWFDAKVDFIRLSHELLVKLAEKRSGLSRHTRTERLQAAHAVIVVIAFFEAVEKLDLSVGKAGFTRDTQLRFFRLTSLFDGAWPLPSVTHPYEVVVEALKNEYRVAAIEIYDLIDRQASATEVESRSPMAMHALAGTAVVRYEELLRQTAADFPELRFWFLVNDNIAARASLNRLQDAMGRLLVGRPPDVRRSDLERMYEAVLYRPIVDADEVPDGLSIPLMGDAYVDPDFQVVPMRPDGQPAAQDWWRGVPVRADLYRYLVGYLTSPVATTSPLFVLGDPGSGKSMLTKVLAARLPASDFLTIRVELRSTPAEADLLDQIEHGVRAALHEDLSWAELTRAAGDALPVVLLDGFDELLQATGVSQSRYLAKIEQFQRDRAEAGYPVAVAVTSRISVTGGVHIPTGAHVLRLVPFTLDHIAQWLSAWNRANESYFERHGLAPLDPQVAFRYRDLAQQPLLLLMLALYDAGGNALQRNQGTLAEGQLYERLLTRFARREVEKDDTDRTDDEVDLDTEGELERLSVVAFAMFNRGTQWVSEADLNDDLAALLDVEHHHRRPGTSAPLSAGEAVLGRFFFVQRAEAVRDTRTLRTYEFLHATFGEYLVARFTWRVLSEVGRVAEARRRKRTAGPVDDNELFALLSFTPLTSRKPVLDFLNDTAVRSPDRESNAALIRRLYEQATQPHLRTKKDYAPVQHPVPARHALYGLNLVLLHGTTVGAFDVRDLGIDDWPRLAGFWRSQLGPGEWQTLIDLVNVEWTEDSSVVLFTGNSVADNYRFLHEGQRLADLTRELHFTADPVANAFRYPLEGMSLREYLSTLRAVVELGSVPDRQALGRDTAARRARDEIYRRWANRQPELVAHHVRGDANMKVDVLTQLAHTTTGRMPLFREHVFDLIGQGWADRSLLGIVGVFIRSPQGMNTWPRAALEAWLRLHEAGFTFPDERDYPDLAELLDITDLDTLFATRPDLAKRVALARRELGLDVTPAPEVIPEPDVTP